MRRYRSLKRAVKRGHFVDNMYGVYRSRKDTNILRQKMIALLKKEDKDGSGED